MADILFINARARENSRTLQLAKHVLDTLEGEITEVRLYDKIDEAGRPSGLPVHYKNEVQKLKNHPKKKIDFVSALKNVCEPIYFEENIP